MSAFEGISCAYLDDVAKACIDAALGLGINIEIIEAADLVSIPAADAGTHTISTDAVVDTGKRWYQWRVGADAIASSTPFGTKGNQSYKNVLTVFIPVGRDAVDKLINDGLNGDFVIRYSTITGDKYLFGTEYSPAMIAEGGVEKVISPEKDGYTITFEFVGKTPFRYTGAVSFTPAL